MTKEKLYRIKRKDKPFGSVIYYVDCKLLGNIFDDNNLQFQDIFNEREVTNIISSMNGVYPKEVEDYVYSSLNDKVIKAINMGQYEKDFLTQKGKNEHETFIQRTKRIIRRMCEL